MTENGTSPFAVSLRPAKLDQDEATNDLVEKIRLINQQRDGFRSVNEEELQLEMNQMKDGGSSDSESEADGEDDEKKGTMESIMPKGHQLRSSLL